jgi:hypothetical protein
LQKQHSNKRQREQDQKDRQKDREMRRADRRERAAARAAAGIVGPEVGDPLPPLGDIEERPQVEREAPPSMQPVKLYVGNLSFETTDADVRAFFAEHGEVIEVHMVTDRDTGRPRGFAFVTMANSAAAAKAMRETNGQLLDGRPLRVNEAEDRRGGGGGPRRRF